MNRKTPLLYFIFISFQSLVSPQSMVIESAANQNLVDHERNNTISANPSLPEDFIPSAVPETPRTESQTNATFTNVSQAVPVPVPTTNPVANETTERATSTVTEMLLTSPSPTKPTNKTIKGLCLCDLNLNVCDLNCCCDLDCTERDKKVFTFCKGSHLYDPNVTHQREQSCHRSFLFYRQNTPYRIDRGSKTLLCIVRENSGQENEYRIDTNDLENIVKTSKPKFGWKSPEINVKKFSLDRYRYGSIVWALKQDGNISIPFPLSLPSSYQGNPCTLYTPVKFLHDSSVKCNLPLDFLKDECGSHSNLNFDHFIGDFQVIGDPRRPEATKVNISKAICSSFPQNCKPVKVIPSAVSEGIYCTNVLHVLNLTIVHGGSDGIFQVIAKAELKDYSLAEKEIRQEIRVQHIWITDGNRTSGSQAPVEVNIKDWARSGNPGYIIGRPVIMGSRVQRNLESNETKSNQTENSNDDRRSGEQGKEDAVMDGIVFSKHPSQWMTILNSGECYTDISTPRRSVKFGMDHSSTCTLRASKYKYCEQLQLQIGRILLGNPDPEEFKSESRFVSAFGNPDETSSHWIPVKVDGSLCKSPCSVEENKKHLIELGCESIVSSLHIQVIYGYVGDVEFPQAKILSVLYDFGDSYKLPKRSCLLNCQKDVDIHVTTTVAFVPVVYPPVTKIAMWPVISIKLPSDFFYPFSTPSRSESVNANAFLYLCSLIYILFNYAY